MKSLRILAAALAILISGAAQATDCTKAAVSKDTTLPLYICIAADTKPTSAPLGAQAYETDSYDTYVFDESGAWVLKSAGVHLTETPAIRNASSSTNSYAVTQRDCNATTVDTSTDSTTVTSVPARICGIYVNTVLSAHTVLLVDGSTTIYTLPASLAAGTYLPFTGRFDTSIVVDPDNSSTGNITVEWRPQ